MTENAVEAPAASHDEEDPKRVFFAFDFTDKTVAAVLEDFVDAPPDGVQPRTAEGAARGPDLWSTIEAEIGRADAVVGMVDHANANVGFELGFALGRGKPCFWGQARSAAPPWLTRAPFIGVIRDRASDRDELAAMVAGEGTVVEGRATLDNGTILLCPAPNLGRGIIQRVRTERPDWTVLDPSGWNLVDLVEKLDGAWRVVWVLLDFDPDVEKRDGQANAAHAAIAGFAAAQGLKVCPYRFESAREVVDVGRQVKEFRGALQFMQLMDELDQTLEADRAAVLAASKVRAGETGRGADQAAPATVAPLDAYRRWVQSAHATTVPFFGTTAKALKDVYVGLNVRIDQARHFEMRGDSDVEEDFRRKSLFSAARLTLGDLLRIPANLEVGVTGRWILLGDPGSGKSTLCRRLSCELARDEAGPLPVFASLNRLAATDNRRDVFDLVAADATRTSAESPAELAADLRERAREGLVWILLDGLDEVNEADAPRVPEILAALAADFGDCPIVVTSRRTAYAGPPEASFVAADLLPLDAPAQRQLLANWIGEGAAASAWERIQRSPRMVELAANPFLLTLIAKLEDEDTPLPPTRGALYDQAVKLLLRRGFGVERREMNSPQAAAAVLAPLSLELQRAGGESWTEDQVYQALSLAAEGSPAVRRALRQDWGDKTGEFLRDVRRNAGVLGPHDGPGGDWRYLHRSLREFLAARALADDEGLDVDGLIALLDTREGQRHWGETVALLVGLLGQEDPRRGALLEAIVTRDHDLAHRTLPQLEGLDPEEALELLDQVPAEESGDDAPWDGVDLAELLRNLRLDGADCGEVRRLVLEPVTPSMETRDLAHRYFALETSGVGVEREAFFRRCGRWPSTGVPNPPAMVRIPPTGDTSVSFAMGSPDGVGHGDERPQRQVTLSAYSMGATAVTEAEYARFDKSKGAKHPNHPVAGVSWWDAWLYARWVGCELPSEAQWECAARAGTTERWSHGDDEAELGEYAWFNGNSENRRHDVGTRKANPWGLLDMHGNVREWCADWLGEYDEAQTEDPSGLAAGADRVLRGGCCWDFADGCRSAYRNGLRPWWRGDYVGFRVVLPSS
ncbi:SUMF1/EgtB/PvdO family nonheme iron enzyme [Engelhardtia mirabilis]|uniref:Serine/threonine-protein kinase pkn1 n=1 Tax=Engelhardtia mirabilis TaxID=2528011 RepID=A0A518BFZ9_9BACT|nr:Serine/threonine-protein kinase pkn1 [Planctomycetes bacterium Pla133]QDV00230.1 Serine/threonine-protein kinase pkn1 [Planctomycetes bacterium Pla86]